MLLRAISIVHGPKTKTNYNVLFKDETDCKHVCLKANN